jgi:hypothetical protein
VRVVGLRPLHFCSSLYSSEFAEKADPGAEDLTNPGTAAPKFTLSQFAIIEF